MTTATKPNPAVMLAKAIRARQADVVRLRGEHAALIDRLAADPTDEAVLTEIGQVEAGLSRASASIDSLQAAAEAAAVKQEAEAATARRKAVEHVRRRALVAAQDRVVKAAELDAAAASFVTALAKFREDSRPVAEDVHAVLVAGATGHQLMAASGLAMPHAAATSSYFSLALAKVIRDLTDLMGPGTMRDHVVTNSFCDVGSASFENAAETAVRQLKERLQ